VEGTRYVVCYCDTSFRHAAFAVKHRLSVPGVSSFDIFDLTHCGSLPCVLSGPNIARNAIINAAELASYDQVRSPWQHPGLLGRRAL
jgi:hypothetical protein